MSTGKGERGQAVVLFAVLMPLMALFLLGLLDYMVSSARLVETMAAADLAAHAGALEVVVQPDGSLATSPRAQDVAIQYFEDQRPFQAQLLAVSCGQRQGRPACLVQARTRSAGYLLPARWITVRALGYLASGVTREDQ